MGKHGVKALGAKEGATEVEKMMIFSLPVRMGQYKGLKFKHPDKWPSQAFSAAKAQSAVSHLGPNPHGTV